MKYKNIYINARYLLSRPTGVERYAYEMCRSLVHEGADITLVCPKNGEIQSAYDITSFNIVRFGVGHSHLWEQLILPFFFIGKRDFLIISFTGLGSILVPHKIMTIHDLSFLKEPSWFSKAYYYYYRMMTPLAVKTSKAIITVSNFSKNEILRFYKFLKPENIHVVYNAVNREKFHVQQKGRKSLCEEPYILAVSSIDPRKNFKRLLEAFKEGNEDCRLKIVGGAVGKIFGTGEYDHLKNDSHIDFLGRVTDNELAQLYANAIGFIYPSLYEGFGLPPLEAMSEGCPVLASDIPVLHETCGDGALYFNPLDVQSIKETVKTYFDNKETLGKGLKAKGFQNVNRFSWNDSAKKLIDIIKQMR